MQRTCIAVNNISDKLWENDNDANQVSITDQKSGLKISILNLLKLTSKFLIGHFLVQNLDPRSKMVVDFLQVLKLFEDELFGDAYYDIKYRKNVKDRKPINLPKNDDVQLLLNECQSIMKSIDVFDLSSETYVTIRSATSTCLIIFNARRGGEPVRLLLRQWEEALHGEWIDNGDLPVDFNDSMLVNYQTGKGTDHLVPVMFPPETHMAMKYLTNKDVRRNAGVLESNEYIFASTKHSDSHASGWHCINDVLKRLNLTGAINATQNRHRVASLLGKLQLSEKEKELIFKHFGHSKHINENTYQAAAGSQQLATTGERLKQINQPKETTSGGNNPCPDEKIGIQYVALEDINPKDAFKTYEENLSDDNDENFKPPPVSETSSDDSEEEVEEPLQKKTIKQEEKRMIWNEVNKSLFEIQFANYLLMERGYPARKEMEAFANDHGLTYAQVRTRIVNTRRLKMEKQNRVRNQMRIDD